MKRSVVQILSLLLVAVLVVGAGASGQTGKMGSTGSISSEAFSAPVYQANVGFGPLSGTPESMARQYLRSESGRLSMKSDLSDISVTLIQESPAGTHIRFQQSYSGIPVYRADLVVSIDRKNRVEFFMSNYKSNISVPTTDAAIDEQSAINRARWYLGVRGGLHGEQTAQLIVKVDDGGRLAYRVIIPAFDPRGDWEVFVDAATGEVISVTDMTCFHKPPSGGSGDGSVLKVDGSGLVFDPDPLTTALATYGSPGYVDGNDADTPELNAQRFSRPLRDITFSGGLYRLTGPYINVLDWDPPSTPVVTATHPDSFRFTRFQDGFEDVNVYHHIDKNQRYIQSLGFTNIQNTSIGADPHGWNGQDNSSYTPSTNRMSFGEGGVDDAEDVDVVLHEYGHAIHHGSVPGWSGSGQQGALGEGFGDYWCESYSRGLNYWQPSQAPYFWVFDWDGHNPFWAGRILNYTPTYPGGLTGAIHTDGQMWASTLMNIWNDIGRSVLDKLVLQSHFYLAASGVTMTQNAEAVIQADRNLNGGANLPSLVQWFGQRGFINPANYVPQITHTPLTDTENLTGPYLVRATIVRGASGLLPSSLKVHWTRTSTFTDSLTMTPTGNPNEFGASIPGNGFAAIYRYYAIARDSGGGFATSPSGAPTSFHSFRAGPDTIPPTVTHTPLRDQARLRWPAVVRATVTDNLGVDSVWVDYMRLRGSLTRTFGLSRLANNSFQGTFNLDTSLVQVGDTIIYKVVARDRSIARNITTHPATGFHRFAIISARGVVLVVDDDPATDAPGGNEKGTDDRSMVEKGAASRLIARTLNEVGFVVDTAGFAAHDPATYPNYDVVIWSAGAKTGTIFGDVAKRAALVTRALAGGKVLVEGGEVGYVYRKSGTIDLDPPFRRHVLHDSLWISDVTTSNLVITNSSHPIFTTPNTITGPVNFTGTAIGARDAMRLMPADPSTRKIGGWSIHTVQGPDSAALIVYNSLPDPGVGQQVFLPFSVAAITDTTTAKRMIENATEFLMARPGGALIVTTPSAMNFGAVQLGDSAFQFLRVQNLGTGSLTVTNITNSVPRYTVSPRNFTLGPQDTVRVRVTFKPTVAGAFNDTLRFVSNATASPTVTLSGRGGIPSLTIRPDSFFVSRPAGTDTTRRTLTVKNSGTDTLRFTIDETLVGLTESMVRSMEQQQSLDLPKGVSGTQNPPVTDGRGGPDAFGYVWIDSDEPGGPTFNWIDIRTIGTAITGLGDDTNLGPFPIGFSFPYYGGTYNQIRVCSNGWFSFTSTATTYSNSAIPSPAEPNCALYAFWDDLNFTTAGTAHYYYDVANSRFIIQYTGVAPFTGTGSFTFQVILKPSGDIIYQYLTMTGAVNSATIGIENCDGTIALQVVNNATYMHDNLAILFTRDAVPWLSVDVAQGVLAPRDSVNISVRLHPGSIAAGTYTARLVVAGNFGAPVNVPVRMDIVVGILPTTLLPTEFALDQNYPNPFNPSTVIKYALPAEAAVTLKVFNLLGQEVATLINTTQRPGFYEATLNAAEFASGVYFYRIDAAPTNGREPFMQVRKMLMLK